MQILKLVFRRFGKRCGVIPHTLIVFCGQYSADALMCLDRYLKVPPLMLVTGIGIGRENLCMGVLFVGSFGKS